MRRAAVSLDDIRAVDPSGQLDDVLALPDHIRDALWRVESAALEPEQSSGLIVCGMGGSAIGGVLARAAIGDRLNLPMLVYRDYELPPWTSPDRAVLCLSYSGNTEETLACFAAAEAIGARRYAATTGGALADAAREAGVPVVGLPGGLQPRHSVGYGFTVACEIAALVGAADGLRTEIDAAAAHLEDASATRWSPRRTRSPTQIAGTVPLIYGCELTAPVAYRWKCQVNENAKQHAFEHQLPELDHNEIVGWTDAQRGQALLGDLPRRFRPAPAPARARRPDREADRATPPGPWSGSRRWARPASSACCGRSCSATSSRWSSPPATGSTPSRSK